LAVEDHMAIDDGDRVAGSGHEPFDVVLARLARCRSRARLSRLAGDGAALLRRGTGRWVEHHDVPHRGGEEVVADAVDEHALPDGEGRLHGAAGNPVGLDDERLDPEGEPEGEGDDQYELDDLVPAG